MQQMENNADFYCNKHKLPFDISTNIIYNIQKGVDIYWIS